MALAVLSLLVYVEGSYPLSHPTVSKDMCRLSLNILGPVLRPYMPVRTLRITPFYTTYFFLYFQTLSATSDLLSKKAFFRSMTHLATSWPSFFCCKYAYRPILQLPLFTPAKEQSSPVRQHSLIHNLHLMLPSGFSKKTHPTLGMGPLCLSSSAGLVSVVAPS